MNGPVRADAPDTKGADQSKPAQAKPKSRPVNFAREVRSILSDNCFACHGPDDKQRKGGLRLDTKEAVLASSGQAAWRSLQGGPRRAT
jgi:mono/diheme cytochrome c family protein